MGETNGMSDGNKVMMLTGEKLKTLAGLVHRQEQARIKSVGFRSERERAQYLRDSLETHQLAVGLVDRAAQLDTGAHGDTTDAARQLLGYVHYGVNTAVRVLWNLHLRRDYLGKIRAHAESLEGEMGGIAGRLEGARAKKERAAEAEAEARAEGEAQRERAEELKAEAEEAEAADLHEEAEAKRAAQAEAVAKAETAIEQERAAKVEFEAETEKISKLKGEGEELVKKIAAYKDTQYEFMLKWKNPSSREFSKALKKKGTTFEKMVKKYQLKLVREKGSAYSGEFEALDDTKKLEVFDEIARSSGRGTLLKKSIGLFVEGLGIAVLVISLGMLVWDIYSSDHKVETGLEEGSELVASLVGGLMAECAGAAVAGWAVGTTVGAEVVVGIATAVGVEVAAVSSALICLTAVVSGFGIGILAGVAAVWAVSTVIKIFETGGKHASNVVKVQPHSAHPPSKPLSMQDIRVYVAPMPNGDLLARQLAYEGGSGRSVPATWLRTS